MTGRGIGGKGLDSSSLRTRHPRTSKDAANQVIVTHPELFKKLQKEMAARPQYSVNPKTITARKEKPVEKDAAAEKPVEKDAATKRVKKETKPVATKPVDVPTEPVVTEPVVTKHVPTEPVVTKPVVTEPVDVPTEPAKPAKPVEKVTKPKPLNADAKPASNPAAPVSSGKRMPEAMVNKQKKRLKAEKPEINADSRFTSGKPDWQKVSYEKLLQEKHDALAYLPEREQKKRANHAVRASQGISARNLNGYAKTTHALMKTICGDDWDEEKYGKTLQVGSDVAPLLRGRVEDLLRTTLHGLATVAMQKVRDGQQSKRAGMDMLEFVLKEQFCMASTDKIDDRGLCDDADYVAEEEDE